jgi:hypothetical protein
MNVLAAFSDGRILEVTESSRVTYRSSNTSVALVDRDGAITPVGPCIASVISLHGRVLQRRHNLGDMWCDTRGVSDARGRGCGRSGMGQRTPPGTSGRDLVTP